MTQVIFLFDIIVTRIELSTDNIDEPQRVAVSLKFFKRPINITGSSINAKDFQGKPIECRMQPEKLRENLGSNGLDLLVRYCGRNVGTAHITFPQSFLDKIEAGMKDVRDVLSCDILDRDGNQVGTLDLLCFLTIKCEEKAKDLEQSEQKWSKLGKAVNKDDILFVVGATDPIPVKDAQCVDQLEPDEGDEGLKLDLIRYRSLEESLKVQLEDTSNNSSTVCALLRAQVALFEGIINSVIKTVSHLYSPPLPDDLGHVPSVPPRRACRPRTISVSVGDLAEEMGIKPLRFCPFCLASMSWLPNYVCCPRCSAKPVPVLQDELKEQLTSDQIMEQYLKDTSEVGSTQSEKETKDTKETTNPCCCKLNKICAHCRVRMKVEDILSPKTIEPPQEMNYVNGDYCIIVDNKEIRPIKSCTHSNCASSGQERKSKTQKRFLPSPRDREPITKSL